MEEFDIIESLGQLLAYYKTDLKYIANFKLFLRNKNIDEYLACNNGFQKFINEFRVARNIKKQKVRKLMELIKNSKLLKSADNVDAFAEQMKNEKITHENKIMTVLASKIFFLNNPEKIIPMDSLNKKALGLQENKYKDFEAKINEFIKTNSKTISNSLKEIEHFLIKIEKNITVEIDFEKYRINRFTDKYLRIKGLN